MKKVLVAAIAIVLAFLFFWSPAFVRADYYLADTSGGLQSSTILFLPGMLGSRLFRINDDGSSTRIWEPLGDVTIKSLAMTPNGESIENVYVDSIIEQAQYKGFPLDNLYYIFANFVRSGVYGSKGKFYPYDWRYDVFDIVDNGTLRADGSREYLVDVVEEEAQSSRSGKVTIVGHSNGGLLAKALMVRLAEKGEANLVDNIILVGSPQVGTAKTIGSLLNAFDVASGLSSLLMTKEQVRISAMNMPGMYGLLPSEKYFELNDKPVIYIDEAETEFNFNNLFPREIKSFTGLQNFLLNNSSGHTESDIEDVHIPIELNEKLLQKERDTHRILDNWTPPPDVTFVEIGGFGLDTVTGFEYVNSSSPRAECKNIFGAGCLIKSNKTKIQPVKDTMGDNTVILSSAHSGNGGYELSFDMREYNTDTNSEYEHKNMMNASPVWTYVETAAADGLLFGDQNPIYTPHDYLYTSASGENDNDISVYSVPAEVLINTVNSNGKETGIYGNGTGEYFKQINIPGSSIDEVGGHTYLYLPNNDTYKITLTGKVALDFEIFAGHLDKNTGKIVEERVFKNIPFAEGSQIVFSVPPLPDTLGVDINADGTVDFNTIYNFAEFASAEEALNTLRYEFSQVSSATQFINDRQLFYLDLWESSDSQRPIILAQLRRITNYMLNKSQIDPQTAQKIYLALDKLTEYD